jgi:DNA polymerase-3 subunit gamma/tau
VSQGPSLYRRHRPQSFDDVVGQEHVVRTLRNAVERDRVHHAYLFVGSRGTGKTSVAKILARSLNCVQGPTVTPCGECESCRTIAAGTSLDVIEMDAASNRSVDDIRELRERVGYAPAAGRWKVYILDEAHMLTREAWNAFLKTLEEPPPHTVFVLCTTEPHKVMPTIVDRCQRFDFQRPSLEQIAEVVRRVASAESIEIEPGAVAAIARAAGGSFRDALGTLDQLVAYGGKKVATDDVLAVLGVAEAELILAAADAIASEDAKAALVASERLTRSGRDVAQFGRDLLAHLRQLLVLRTVDEVPDTFSVTAADPERLRTQAEAFSELALARAIDTIAKALADIKEGDEPRMTLELAMLRAARPQLDPTRQALLQRVESLEQAVGGRPGVRSGKASSATEPHAAPADDQPSRPKPREAPLSDSSDSSVDADPDEALGDAGSVEGAEEPARGPAAVGVKEGLDLDRISGLWPGVLDQMRESGSELLSTVFSAARPVAVDAQQGVLELGFPKSAAFNKRKAEAQEARDRLADAVMTVLGERLRPVYKLLEGEEGGGDEQRLSEEELIERFKSEFDAEEFEETDNLDAEEAR